MVWNLIIPIVSRYATIITLPVAIGILFNSFILINMLFVLTVVGGLGYYIERRYRGVSYTPVPHEKTIIDERSERQDQEQPPTASPYRMDTVVPKTIFERNNPENLKKFS
jgi:hypothetical protein